MYVIINITQKGETMEKERKILATLVPASHSVEMIEGLIKAGKEYV